MCKTLKFITMCLITVIYRQEYYKFEAFIQEQRLYVQATNGDEEDDKLTEIQCTNVSYFTHDGSCPSGVKSKEEKQHEKDGYLELSDLGKKIQEQYADLADSCLDNAERVFGYKESELRRYAEKQVDILFNKALQIECTLDSENCISFDVKRDVNVLCSENRII